MSNNEGMRRQPPLGEVGGAKSLPLNSSLGPGSALGETGKKSAGEASREVQYFSYLTPFFAFFSTVEPGPRLIQFS